MFHVAEQLATRAALKDSQIRDSGKTLMNKKAYALWDAAKLVSNRSIPVNQLYM